MDLIPFSELSRELVGMVRVWRNDDRIRTWLRNTERISEQEHRQFVGRLQRDETKDYRLVKEGDDLLGTINLTNIRDGRAEIGLYKNPDTFDTRGIGSKLMEAVFALAREHEVNDLFLVVREDNTRAIRLYEKYGFQATGREGSFICMERRIS